MRTKIEQVIGELKFAQLDDGLKYNLTLSIFRTILGYAALGAITLAEEQADDSDALLLGQSAQKMLRPADGDFVFVLDSVLPILWERGICSETREWFRAKISPKCSEIIFERNNRQAHGIFDQNTAQGWDVLLTKIEDIYSHLWVLIPSASTQGLMINGLPFGIQFPTDQLCCLRTIARKSDGWRYIFQKLDFKNSKEQIGYLDANSPLPRLLSENRNALATKIINDEWRPSFVLPHKQTTSFLGRGEQLDDLKEWWDDEFSRTCLIYGEGGIGKTTLALEFLNRVLDEEIEIDWKPDYIFFFSSKQTRWGINGMEKISGVQTNLSEATIRLVSALDIVPIDQRWYSVSPSDVVSKASQIINDIGLKNKILFVIDNAENLVRNSQDESDLAALIKIISRKIGRVIVTSRRREKIEAEQIQVLSLEDDEGAILLKGLLRDADFKDIPDITKLKEHVGRIGSKPILIEFLAKYAVMTNTPLERGVDEILRQESGDLGQFLFADSWGRIKEQNQRVFMAIAQLGGFVDDVLLSMLTAKFLVKRDEWSSAYEETKYGESNFYSGKQEIILDEGARNFIAGRYLDVSKEIRREIDLVVQDCKAKYSEYLQNQRIEIKDRIEQAFIHPLARQAKIASSKGDYLKAKEFYEQAIVSDASNAYLYDRFAWFTMKHLSDFSTAESLARRAYALANADPDVNFTLGMIFARQGNVPSADQYLSNAKNCGKERYLVQLQMAYARYTAIWMKKTPSSNEELQKINELLDASMIGEPYLHSHHRHNDEINRLRLKAHRAIKKDLKARVEGAASKTH